MIKRVEESEEELSQATAASDEFEQKFRTKEKEFLETVGRLKEVDKRWSDTQSALEKEQEHNVELERERGIAVLDQKKVCNMQVLYITSSKFHVISMKS